MSEGAPHISTPMGQLHWNLWLAGLGTTAANRVIEAISKTHVLVPKTEIEVLEIDGYRYATVPSLETETDGYPREETDA